MASTATLPSPSHVRKRHFSTTDYEPSDQWKANLKAQIEQSLASMVDEAERRLASTLAEGVVNEARREEISEKHKDTMRSIRRLAQEQFAAALERERQERRWAAGQVVEDGWSDVLAKEQQAIMDSIKKEEGERTRSRSSTLEGATQQPADHHQPSHTLSPPVRGSRDNPPSLPLPTTRILDASPMPSPRGPPGASDPAISASPPISPSAGDGFVPYSTSPTTGRKLEHRVSREMSERNRRPSQGRVDERRRVDSATSANSGDERAHRWVPDELRGHDRPTARAHPDELRRTDSSGSARGGLRPDKARDPDPPPATVTNVVAQKWKPSLPSDDRSTSSRTLATAAAGLGVDPGPLPKPMLLGELSDEPQREEALRDAAEQEWSEIERVRDRRTGSSRAQSRAPSVGPLRPAPVAPAATNPFPYYQARGAPVTPPLNDLTEWPGTRRPSVSFAAVDPAPLSVPPSETAPPRRRPSFQSSPMSPQRPANPAPDGPSNPISVPRPPYNVSDEGRVLPGLATKPEAIEVLPTRPVVLSNITATRPLATKASLPGGDSGQASPLANAPSAWRHSPKPADDPKGDPASPESARRPPTARDARRGPLDPSPVSPAWGTSDALKTRRDSAPALDASDVPPRPSVRPRPSDPDLSLARAPPPPPALPAYSSPSPTRPIALTKKRSANLTVGLADEFEPASSPGARRWHGPQTVPIPEEGSLDFRGAGGRARPHASPDAEPDEYGWGAPRSIGIRGRPSREFRVAGIDGYGTGRRHPGPPPYDDRSDDESDAEDERGMSRHGSASVRSFELDEAMRAKEELLYAARLQAEEVKRKAEEEADAVRRKAEEEAEEVRRQIEEKVRLHAVAEATRKAEEAVRRVEDQRRKEEEIARKEEEFKRWEEELSLWADDLDRRESLQKRKEELLQREELLRQREEMQRQKEELAKQRALDDEHRRREEDLRRRSDDRKRHDSVSSASGSGPSVSSASAATTTVPFSSSPSRAASVRPIPASPAGGFPADRSSATSSNWTAGTSPSGTAWSTSTRATTASAGIAAAQTSSPVRPSVPTTAPTPASANSQPLFTPSQQPFTANPQPFPNNAQSFANNAQPFTSSNSQPFTANSQSYTPSAQSFSANAQTFGASAGAGPSGRAPTAPPVTEAEWARRQAEQAKKQQEQFRREQERLEREKQAKAAKVVSKEDVVQLFQKHEQQWALVRSAPKLRWDTFPWPVLKRPSAPEDLTTPAISAYVLSPHHPTDVGKPERDRIKEQIKRWHPDRFETQLLPKVNDEERAKVKEGAGWVARGLNDLLTQSNSAANSFFG